MRGLRQFRFGGFFGGLHADYAHEVIPSNAFTRSDNFVLHKSGVEKTKGWEKFSQQQLTDGEASPAALPVVMLDEYILRNGTNYLMVFTEKRPYYYHEIAGVYLPLWMPDYGVSTSVNANSTAGTTTLNVASTTGFTSDDAIIINRNGPREEIAVIASVGSSSLTLHDNLQFTHTAADADSVEKLAQTCNVDAAAGNTYIDINDTTPYSAGEEILVGWGTNNAEYLIVDSVVSATRLNVSRPSWAPSGTGLQNNHAGGDFELVVRLASIKHDDITSSFADIYNDKYYWTSYNVEAQGLDMSSPIIAMTTTSNIYLFGDLERGDISSNTALRDCEGLSTGTLCRPKFIRAFENFVVIGYLQEGADVYPQKVRWCRYADPTQWKNNADGSGQAGYFMFTTPDFIMGMHQLKRSLIIYRERSIEAMRYVGYPNVFAFATVETGTGLIAPGALVDLGDAHIFCGPDNIWQYDGVTLRAIGDPIKETFFNMLDPSKKSKVRMFYVEETDDVILAFSQNDENNHDKAFVYNVALNQWSGPIDMNSIAYGWYDRQESMTWNNATGTWDDYDDSWDGRRFRSNNPLSLMGNSSGYVYILGESEQMDGSDFTATFETKLTDCDIPMLNKRLEKVRIGLKEVGNYTIDVYAGAADYEGEDVTWHGPYTVSVNENANPFVSVDVRGRFFKIRIEGTIPNINIRDIELFFKTGSWR